ncbi:hypothetical protein INS49_000056 [Diaporthe citri]|uniref:uncharacterized protein n=1 Tax=Diaporthe citri TaxID=83186 RepID=UPI001C81FD71|nr:uncharacterized protein INS49_000056 [Diaporthe citri]KAG6365880.1 hypothetical protein INS49_000056 [Diaporthe citri]
MDPDCAICHAPATAACDCEAKGLETAIRQAEARMMQSIYSDIRSWVRAHAQDYILEYFRLLTDRRKQAHTAHLDRITSHAYHFYHAPPHPNEIAAAQAALKRGIDEDWQASVQRYPEVLEYFYSLVELTLPPDDDPAVRDPPLSALNGSRKASRRSGGFAPTVASGPSMDMGRRTPPPIAGPARVDRRTPGPTGREQRHSASYGRPVPAPGYYGAPAYYG